MFYFCDQRFSTSTAYSTNDQLACRLSSRLCRTLLSVLFQTFFLVFHCSLMAFDCQEIKSLLTYYLCDQLTCM